jgi:hypothetical protein
LESISGNKVEDNCPNKPEPEQPVLDHEVPKPNTNQSKEKERKSVPAAKHDQTVFFENEPVLVQGKAL